MCLTVDMLLGVHLAGILRGTHGERRRWVGAEWGRVRGGVSPLQPTRGLGKRRDTSSPNGVRGRVPAENGFWPILKATERSFCTYMTKNLRETTCISVPPVESTPNSGGLVPPPVIYTHDVTTDRGNNLANNDDGSV